MIICGLVGWWMVRSGLEEPAKEWERPRVSPYRLAAHLVSAFSIYSVLVWTALDLAPRRYEVVGGGGGVPPHMPSAPPGRMDQLGGWGGEAGVTGP